MSTPPILTFAPKIDPEAPAWLRQHLTLIYQKLGNHTQAMSLLAKQKVSTTTSTTVIEAGTSGGGGGGTGNTVGAVDNQSGVTTYVTQSGDYGALLVLSDASPIAVSLTTQTPPWFCWITNQGTGLATLTPSSGTISFPENPGAASMPLPAGMSCLVAFDGTNWWAQGVLVATVSSLGVVQPDGTTIGINGSGVISTAGLRAYDIALYTPGTFVASQVCLELNVVRAFTLPINLTGSIAKLDTAATASTVFSITRNGSSIGTITFAASGSTGTFAFSAAVTFAAGDVLKIAAPASPDATAAGLSVTLEGSR